MGLNKMVEAAPSLSVGIALPANTKGGPQKLTAIAASDLARAGHNVSIFVPVLPYYYYRVRLGGRYLSWIKACYPYFSSWARDRRFAFQELVETGQTGGQVKVKFVLRRASKRQLAGLDFLLFHTIAQVAEYQDRFPQERQVYLIHHPEEHNHGHTEIFSAMRGSFKGKTLTVSPFTAKAVSGHIPTPPVVPNPVSPSVWNRRGNFAKDAQNRDILLFWKDYQSGSEGANLVKAILQKRPGTTVTVWCRGPSMRKLAQEALPGTPIVDNLKEEELCDLYAQHRLLLFCSRYEGFGMPPIEALACGCIPVLHPNVGAVEMYASDGQNAIFIDETEEETTRKILCLLDDADKLQGMRKSGLASIDSFNPEGYGQRLLAAAGIL